MFFKDTSSSLGRWYSPSRFPRAFSSASRTCGGHTQRDDTPVTQPGTSFPRAKTGSVEKVYLETVQHGELRWQPREPIRAQVDVRDQQELVQVAQRAQVLLCVRKRPTG